MATVPCPGCAAALEPAQEVCPACRRPRGPDEIEAGRFALAAADEERRRRPRRAAGAALAVAALAGLFAARGP
ncbi:MAG: hypothetical protein SF051_07040, partial [Elusimicrobiota bacterium]|nr:hypothetical protein [Elusimicrobiota bacterium]